MNALLQSLRITPEQVQAMARQFRPAAATDEPDPVYDGPFMGVRAWLRRESGALEVHPEALYVAIRRGKFPDPRQRVAGRVRVPMQARYSERQDVRAWARGMVRRGATACRVLEVLRQAGRPMETGEIVAAMGSTMESVRDSLRKLRRRGAVRRVGEIPTPRGGSPRSIWEGVRP